MTKLLAIETSTEACSVALYCNGETSEFYEFAPMRHAELLLPAVQSLLDAAGLPLAGLDAIAFGRGPGSFTSLRIGIGVVQGLAWGAGLPVVPVSSLAAVAQATIEKKGKKGSDPFFPFFSICVAMDARMQEVYTANFQRRDDGYVMAAGEERVCSPDGVSAPGDGPFIAAGNGFERFEELRPLAAKASECYPDIWPRAGMIGKLALKWLESNEPLTAGLAQPVYVRNNVASKQLPRRSEFIRE
jgi:tRNA threonylcarbamoyladenosine biosynthesis protein TsaB